MNQPKISVIIPVYNASKYLFRTYESLKNQTIFDDIEIIVVDNNSDDDSNAMLSRAANLFRQVTLVNETKQGVSAARNKGIDLAKGQYLIFIDADDSQSDDCLEKLCQAMEDVDIAVCGYDTFVDGKSVYKSPEDKPKMFDNKSFANRLFEVEHYQGFIWNKMFRRDIIIDNNIRFDEDIFFNEDRLFIVSYLMHCEKVRQIPDHLYNYYINTTSAQNNTMAGDEFPKDTAFTEIDSFAKMIKMLEAPGFEKALQTAKSDMVFSEMRLLDKILDQEQFARFRHYSFRKHALHSRKYPYNPKNEEEQELLRKLKTYGLLGISYRKNND